MTADQTWNLRRILTECHDHDGIGWPAMFAYLRTYDHRKITDLTVSIVSEGVREPVAIDLNSKQVLDGNHRLAVLESLDWRDVPVLLTEGATP